MHKKGAIKLFLFFRITQKLRNAKFLILAYCNPLKRTRTLILHNVNVQKFGVKQFLNVPRT